MREHTSNTWVLIRGLGREAEHWGGFTQLCKDELGASQVLTPDLPGCGVLHADTRVQSNICALREIVREQVLAQIKQNQTNRVNIIALSLGGMIGMDWAQTFPDEVDKLVLINTSSKWSPFWSRINFGALLPIAWSYFRGIEVAERAILNHVSNVAMQQTLALPAWIAIQHRHRVSKRTMLRLIWAAAKYQPQRTAPQVSGLVLSSKKDRLVSPQCSTAISTIWNWPHREHETAGHDLPLDDPQWLIAQVKLFLNN